MKNRLKNIGLLIGAFLLLFVASCDDIDPITEEIQFDRVFTPLELDVKISNQVTAILNWSVVENIDHYVIEFSKDSLAFTDIINTVTVLPAEIPYSITLEGATQYSARLKGVSINEGQDDSKWAKIAFKTKDENIFEPLTDENIGKSSVTLNWPSGSEVTHFIITQGDIQRNITDEEKVAGEATITGLTYDTQYKIVMYDGTNPKQRGAVTFTTMPEGITLSATDDLNEIITNAAEGDVFLLEGGDYTAYGGTITINKSIKLKGLLSSDKPILHVQFVLEEGVQSAEFISLEMNGNYLDSETGLEEMLDNAFQYATSDAAYGLLKIEGCNVHNYNKSFISGGSVAFSATSILVDNCIVSDILNDGGDFMDFRKSYIANLTVQNTTFYNCATDTVRDFVRMDGSSKGNAYDDGSNIPVIDINHCTFYNVMNSSSSTKRFFYVRWTQHTLISSGNLFAEMGNSVYSNQSLTLQPDCSGNNYFNAENYYVPDTGGKNLVDNSSDYTTLNPGFSDAANGDFTISETTLIDNLVGDPRWR